MLPVSLAIAGQIKAETIQLNTFHIPLMVENEHQGIFIELVRSIEDHLSNDIKIKVFPANRAILRFHANLIDGLFPALDVMLSKPYIRSNAIYIKEDFGFVVKGKPVPATLDDLKGKRIGLTDGYPYCNELFEVDGIHFEYARSDVNNIGMLARDRIDVFIVEEKSGLRAFSKSATRIHYDYHRDSPLSRMDVYFAFQNSSQGKRYAELFNNALSIMQRDGSFASIFAKVNVRQNTSQPAHRRTKH